ncbi:hypothetical protein PIB30_045206 [Stylosanthes scabra]|uniref:Leucine-rich repeat-containing N-terminal plant-type domain-containing protein n=1 Tax=Stylosanthes scabra TaxID=79078 RepID=A0ABU6RG39_9FABA|nr:hypothetical protein [Stylosanthes scabra]
MKKNEESDEKKKKVLLTSFDENGTEGRYKKGRNEMDLIKLVSIYGEVKCLDKERRALLTFKQGIRDVGMLSTWRDEDDCCKWEGITCSNQTGHVLRLHLPGSGFHGLISHFNISTLIDLQNLEHLDLSGHQFLNSYISEHIGLFTKLRYLNLSNAEFSGRIPPQLGSLTHLQYLDLSYNFLEGEIPSQLKHLGQLQYLGLQSVAELQGEITFQNRELSGAIPFQSGDLPLLQTLKLGGDFFLQTKDAEWVSNLSFLKNIDLTSFSLGNSHQWLQMIRKHIPNLTGLRLSDCNLSDNDVEFLFDIQSNNSSTSSLTILDFSDNMLTLSIFQLLSKFGSNLQELYLSMFQGNFNFGPNLEQLDLSNCNLSDTSFLMPSTSIVNSSSSLVVLSLSYNLLTSSNIFHWIFNFTANLHTLYLSGNLLEGPIPKGFDKAMNSLEYLDLSINKLQGEIPPFLGNICTLQILDLSHNNLNGDISRFIQNSSWCNRHVFLALSLSFNRITGMIPKSIGLLSNLMYLALEGNSLTGEITESHLTNFSKLVVLILSNNSFSLKFDPDWIPPFQLIDLEVASCKLGPNFPSWLHTQNNLIWLDISDTGINGSVPEWFWYMLPLLLYCSNMSHNNLVGAVPNLALRLPHGVLIDLSSNQFEGVIPSFLLHASSLILSENKFSNTSSLLCQNNNIGKNLGTLVLANNQLEGSLPDCWESVTSLLFLDLSNNKLTGKIPPSMGSLVKLEALVLRNNRFIGKLPSNLKNCTNLFLLDVSENLLSGPIPSWIGETLQRLIVLSMAGNRFSGNLSKHLCYLKKIQALDLSKNKLSNEIPTCLQNFTAMSKKSINSTETTGLIYWKNNTYYETYGFFFSGYTFNITLMWKGVKSSFKNPELRLNNIDLSSNHFTGEIPKEIVYLVGLVSLNLSSNNLSGEIPAEIGNITSLESLDLSRNHISGTIPSSLSQIDNLGKLDLSNNFLSGRIPPGRHMDTFDASCFEGNPDLCGSQLNKTCPGDMAPVKPEEPTTHDDEDDNSGFYEALHMSLGFGFFTGFWGLLGPLLLWKRWRIAYLRFLNKVADYIYVTAAVYASKFHK